MKCGQSRRLFGAYWDDELTQAEREWLELHFAACSGCRAAYDELARTVELLGSLPRAEVGPGLAERALARARRRGPAPDRIPARTPRWVPVTAGVALVAVVAGLALQLAGTRPASRLGSATTPAVERIVIGAREEVTSAPRASEPALRQPITSDPAALRAAAEIPDSLFDHAEDVELVLDPVTLRKGRAHPPSRLAPAPARGQQAVITF